MFSQIQFGPVNVSWNVVNATSATGRNNRYLLFPPLSVRSRVLTVITRVNFLSQQEAAELVFSMDGVLDLHQVGCHAERIVLQIALTLLTTAGNKLEEKSKMRPNQIKILWLLFILDFKLNTGWQCFAIFPAYNKWANEDMYILGFLCFWVFWDLKFDDIFHFYIRRMQIEWRFKV